MSRDGRAEIDVGDDLAVDDDKGLFVQLFADAIQRAGRAEYFRLFYRVIYPDSVIRSVADLRSHRIRFVMQIDDQIPDAVALQVFDRKSDQRAVEKRDRRFSPPDRQRPQARPETGGQNHCFHESLLPHSGESHILKRYASPPTAFRLNRKITLQYVFIWSHAEQFNSPSDNLLSAFEFDECPERRFIKHDV